MLAGPDGLTTGRSHAAVYAIAYAITVHTPAMMTSASTNIPSMIHRNTRREAGLPVLNDQKEPKQQSMNMTASAVSNSSPSVRHWIEQRAAG